MRTGPTYLYQQCLNHLQPPGNDQEKIADLLILKSSNTKIGFLTRLRQFFSIAMQFLGILKGLQTIWGLNLNVKNDFLVHYMTLVAPRNAEKWDKPK